MFIEILEQSAAARGIVAIAVALVWVLVLVRLVGLRSFSKMTAFDFVATVAAGSLLANAGVASSWASFVQTIAALSALFGLQVLLAFGRRRSAAIRRLLDNEPLLLARDGVIDETALRKARVARADVIEKLREANALSFAAVHAVVLEATGDISVLHGDRDVDVDDTLLEGVRGWE